MSHEIGIRWPWEQARTRLGVEVDSSPPEVGTPWPTQPLKRNKQQRCPLCLPREQTVRIAEAGKGAE